MTTWDERFREGDYPQNPDPSAVLRRYVDPVPDGRALDVATGTGRNAVFLAREGYAVDAIDQSREGLEITGANAADAGVADRLDLVQADVPSYRFPEDTYDVVTISFYRALDRFADIKESLVPGGVLFVEHHLRTTNEVTTGPSTDRYRFAANELLHACLDMTVLHYEEGARVHGNGKRGVTARILARDSTGPRQAYPELPAMDLPGGE